MVLEPITIRIFGVIKSGMEWEGQVSLNVPSDFEIQEIVFEDIYGAIAKMSRPLLYLSTMKKEEVPVGLVRD